MKHEPRSIFVVALLLSFSCDSEQPVDEYAEYCETCNLDDQIPEVAVEAATDCGQAQLDEDATPVLDCVEQALADGAPFIARQQLQGIDSAVIYAWVTNAEGTVVRLSYDSNICGGAMCADGCGPRVSMAACGNPRTGAMPQQSIIDCDLGPFSALCEPPS